MKRRRHSISLVVAAALLLRVNGAAGAGVTVITHGFASGVTDWVAAMAAAIPQYAGFPGTNSSRYLIAITRNASGQFLATPTFLAGTSPLAADSGEIVVLLDWSSLSSFGGASTTNIAQAAAAALLATNFIPELAGRPLAQLPLHFIGHSRGGSVVTEMAGALGAQGVWVDQVTTLDPYPVAGLGDPPVKNYPNTLFADNYWQDQEFPQGQPIAGAYNRHLLNLTGGYAASTHSDVHLWYHGTVDGRTPTTDSLATLTRAERQAWWTAAEAAGTNTGFRLSLIGGGDRLSALEPAGTGTGRIRDGFNQTWDLGAGAGTNRDAGPANNGAWPNLIRLGLTATHPFAAGDPVPLRFHYQFGAVTSLTASVRLFLDRDRNPYNANETELLRTAVAGTGTNAVAATNLNVPIDPARTGPGTYFLFGEITDGSHARFLYASQPVVITASRQAPLLAGVGIVTNRMHFTIAGFPGQTVVIQASADLAHWVPLQTNTLAGTALEFGEPRNPGLPARFYRVVLAP